MFCNGSRGPRAPPGQRNRQQAGRTLKTSSAKRSSSKKATGKPSSATKRASSRPARSGASREHGFWPNVRKGAHNVGVGLDAFADGEREKQKERMKEQQQARRDLQKSQLRGDPEPQIAPNLTEMFILVNRAWKELKEEEEQAERDEYLATVDPSKLDRLRKQRLHDKQYKDRMDLQHKQIAENSLIKKRFKEIEEDEKKDGWVAVMKADRLFHYSDQYPALTRQVMPKMPNRAANHIAAVKAGKFALHAPQVTLAANPRAQVENPKRGRRVHYLEEGSRVSPANYQLDQEPQRHTVLGNHSDTQSTGRQAEHGHGQHLHQREAASRANLSNERSKGVSPAPTAHSLRTKTPQSTTLHQGQAQTHENNHQARPGRDATLRRHTADPSSMPQEVHLSRTQFERPKSPEMLSPQENWQYCAKSSPRRHDPEPIITPSLLASNDATPTANGPRHGGHHRNGMDQTDYFPPHDGVTAHMGASRLEVPERIPRRGRRATKHVRFGSENTGEWAAHDVDDSDEWTDDRSADGSIR